MKEIVKFAAPLASAARGWRRSGRMIRTLLGPTLLTMVVATTLASSANAAAGDITLASTSDGGATKANGFSSGASMSADGTTVAFSSSATNLDPGDITVGDDAYVKDLATGNITLASTNDAGIKGIGTSFGRSLSADGTKVAFDSNATNLDPGDTSAGSDVYVKDLITGNITLASTNDAGIKGNGTSSGSSLSADGTTVAFNSDATNLDSGDADFNTDVYVKDLQTGNITVASTNDAGIKGNGLSTGARISADGTTVAFSSSATNLDPADTESTTDVYVKDLQTGDITLASTGDSGTKGNFSSIPRSLSVDGTKVAFDSNATNLDPGDTNANRDIYVKDLVTGNLTLASTDDAGTKGNGISEQSSLSADGTTVAFHSGATNLDPGDTDSNQDVYVKDLVTGNITLASTSDAGTKGNGNSAGPSLNADGTAVAFNSGATNLDPGDTDTIPDVYVKELESTPTPVNQAPVTDAGPDGSIAEGQTFSSSGSFSDPDSSSWTGAVDYGDGSGAQALGLTGTSFSLGHVYDDDGSYTANVSITDGQGGSGSDTALVDVANVAPIASFAAPSPITEGGSSALSMGGASDPSAADTSAGFRYAFACDGLAGSLASSYAAAGMDASASCGFADDGTYPVKGRILDNDDGATTYDASVVVENASPSVGVITAPADPVAFTTPVSASAPFTDAGVLDTHTALVGWGDGTSSAGAVTEASGSGSANGSHAYSVPGVYTVTLTVSDDEGGQGQSLYQYIVVYDPNGPSVRGRGTILSPPGAYAADPSLTGEAVLGFQSGYRHGATVPSGHTRFSFRIAALTFVSRDYDWLVVAGARAQFKGTGEINGGGSYGFLLTAVDGDRAGGGGLDKFRIKIWDKATSAVVYDNKMGASDNADPQTLADGSIVIG